MSALSVTPSAARLGSKNALTGLRGLRTRTAHTTKARTCKSLVKAETTWFLDGVGCSPARSDDVNLIAHSKEAKHCPSKPINLTYLCEEKEDHEFAMLDAKFELEKDNLYISNISPLNLANDAGVYVDGKFLPPFGKAKLRPGSKVQLGDQEFEVNRNIHAHA